MTTKLTEHFTLEEMIASDTARREGIDNEPGPNEIVNLYRLALALEVVRENVFGGRPLVLSSGFRNPELNVAVGGSEGSYHIDACAGDFDPPHGMSHDEVQQKIANDGAIAFDLVMEERTVKPESEGGSVWIHFQIPRRGKPARRAVLDATVDRLGGTIVRIAPG